MRPPASNPNLPSTPSNPGGPVDVAGPTDGAASRFEVFWAIQDAESGLACLISTQFLGQRDVEFMAEAMNRDPEVAKRHRWEPAFHPEGQYGG